MVKIRKAKMKDVNELGSLWEEFMKDHSKLVTKNKDYKARHELKKNAVKDFKIWIKKNIKSSKALVLVAEDKGKLVGYCLSLIKKNVPVFEIKNLGYISDLFLKKKYRRKRIGREFYEETIKWLKKKKIKYLTLTVWATNNRAINAYKAWGLKDFNIVMQRRI